MNNNKTAPASADEAATSKAVAVSSELEIVNAISEGIKQAQISIRRTAEGLHK